MNIMIEMDYLGEDLNTFENGVVIARLEMDDKDVCLETNGESGDRYLELVNYEKNGQDYVDGSFSDPIWEMPKTTKDVEELFSDWLEGDDDNA